jgi:acyl-CoA reductase-like NAD-dependent aldehyde dehydrogenase
MWIFGGVLLALGINGLIPVTYTWQMPLWMSIPLIIVGALIVIFSNAEDTPTSSRARPPPP